MKKKLTSFLTTFFVCIVFVFCLATTSHALTWDGSASAGGVGDSNSPGAFEVGYLEAAKATGYRFSIVNSSGAVQKGPIDVFRSATSTSHINRAKVSVKYAKSLLKNAYTSVSFKTTTDTSGSYLDTNIGVSLPELTTGIEAFCTTINVNTLFSKAGWTYVNADGETKTLDVAACDSKGWSVLVEPIFAVKLNGENCVFTVTEIAAYGAYIYGADNYVTSAASGTSWANISYYTNRDWPNALRAENGYGLFTAATALTSYKTSFKTIITHGYGVGILYGENLTAQANTVYHYAWGFKNGEGNNSAGTAFKFDTTQFSAASGSTYTMDGNKAATRPNGFYVNGAFSSNSISGSWASYAFGTKVTQKAAPMAFEYNYYPYTYDITYELDGGTNNSANPSTYNVLYGVTLKNPTKAGYTFAGWYNGDTKVTGINSGATASFTSASDMYSKLSTRTTGNITLTAKWVQNKITVNYYSNYATESFSGALNTVGASKNVLVRTCDFYAATAYPDGLHNYVSSSNGTYLGRAGYTATGNWGTSTSGGTLVNQDTSFTNGMALAKAFGKDISSVSATVNVYAQWTANKNNVLFDINYGDVNTNLFVPNSDATTNGVTMSTNKSTGIITLDGDSTGSVDIGTVHGLDLVEGDKYTITLEYIGGSYSALDDTKTAGSFPVDFMIPSGSWVSPRQTGYPSIPTESNPIGKTTMTVNATSAAQAVGLHFWMYHYGGFSFDNYQFTVKIEKDSSYTGYSPYSSVVKTASTYGANGWPAPTREGYLFDGWYTKAEGGTEIYSTTVFNADSVTTLYAHWVPALTYDYNNTYEFDSDECADSGHKVNWDKDFTITETFNVSSIGSRYLIIGNFVSADPNAINIEVTAAGALRVWLDGVDKSYGTITPGENITLVFNWDSDSDTYTISATGTKTNISFSGSYAMSGSSSKTLRMGTADYRGSSVFSSITVESLKISVPKEVNEPLGSLPVPTENENNFIGWYTKAEGGEEVTSETKVSGPIVIYAQWTPDIYEVSYDANGGYGAPENQTKVHAQDLTLSKEIPSRSNYLFVAWNTKADGSGDKYLAGATYAKNEDVVLYAQWKNTDDVEFMGVGYSTIMVGDVFEPEEHTNAFNLAKTISSLEVIYNGVPRDSENRATTTGTGYTVVYNIAFEDGTTGQYRLIVTVLDETMVEQKVKGYIRFISLDHLDTLSPFSKWRAGSLNEALEKTLNIKKPTNDSAIQVWSFKPEDIQNIKSWVKTETDNGTSRQKINNDFITRFDSCKIK